MTKNCLNALRKIASDGTDKKITLEEAIKAYPTEKLQLIVKALQTKGLIPKALTDAKRKLYVKEAKPDKKGVELLLGDADDLSFSGR